MAQSVKVSQLFLGGIGGSELASQLFLILSGRLAAVKLPNVHCCVWFIGYFLLIYFLAIHLAFNSGHTARSATTLPFGADSM